MAESVQAGSVTQWQVPAGATRGDYMKRGSFISRDVVVGVASAILFAGTCRALKRATSSWARLVLRETRRAAGCMVVARPLTAALLHRSIFPVRGYHMFLQGTLKQRDSWNHLRVEKALLTTLDQRPVNVRLLEGNEGQSHSGEVVIFNGGNGYVFEQTLSLDFKALHRQGYRVGVYHPPGHGKTPGPRSPETDFLAAEAIMQWLMSQKGVRKNQSTSSGTQ